MPQWRDQFRVWIKIDGVDAEEYGVEVDEAKRVVSCWIGSEVGKTFSVEWDTLSANLPLKGTVLMDGTLCAGKLNGPGLLSRHHTFAGVSSGNFVQPFVFGALTLSDDDALLDATPNLAELGVIALKITPVAMTARKSTPHNDKSAIALPSLNIHEQSKKAVTQQVQLGAPQPVTRRPKTGRSSRAERTGPSLVKFRFQYRPIEILRANGIAPLLKRRLSPSPSQSAEPRPDGGDEADEVERLEEQLLAAKARRAAKQVDKKPRVKRELGVVDLTGPDPLDRPPAKKKVKREGSSEVIDLT
ncbi:hypothetical protein MIND_00105400 [Mycena indigotica]|uniref:DUF7918 domain-containing protein n=1 Tax=Mycena indigotica TaxID=2126181 RepID=A0A8H6WI96_9AGAR|nr:uncharacterized protein MIND_00105400 [Mycena indigotica]KAF7315888.1 hypothetical protein MIND_00105400 [Mycena indigotica]